MWVLGILNKYILLILLITFFASCNEQAKDTVTIEEINELSVFVFSSENARKNILEARNRIKLIDALLLAIAVSTNNLRNHDTTVTMFNGERIYPYQYEYVYVNDSLQLEVRRINLYRYHYDPYHPDAILQGEMSGFVKYPDINPDTEANNIAKILEILLKLNRQ